MWTISSPTNWSYSQEITWHWPWIAILVPAFLLFPLLIWRRAALGYASVACILLFLAIGIVWVRDYRKDEALILDFQTRLPSPEGRTVAIQSCAGGLELNYSDTHLNGSVAKYVSEKPWTFSYSHTGNYNRYPSTFQPAPWLYTRLGFRLLFLHQPDNPKAVTAWRLWELIVPNWFPMVLLAIVPAFWVRRQLKRRQLRRRAAHGLCAHCGYDLRAHRAGEKCPECGTAIPEPAHAGAPQSSAPGSRT